MRHADPATANAAHTLMRVEAAQDWVPRNGERLASKQTGRDQAQNPSAYNKPVSAEQGLSANRPLAHFFFFLSPE